MVLLQTSLPGLSVAGHVRDRTTKRAASPVGEGCKAVQLLHQCLGGIAVSAR